MDRQTERHGGLSAVPGPQISLQVTTFTEADSVVI